MCFWRGHKPPFSNEMKGVTPQEKTHPCFLCFCVFWSLGLTLWCEQKTRVSTLKSRLLWTPIRTLLPWVNAPVRLQILLNMAFSTTPPWLCPKRSASGFNALSSSGRKILLKIWIAWQYIDLKNTKNRRILTGKQNPWTQCTLQGFVKEPLRLAT